MKQTTLPSGVVSMAPVPKDLGPANTEERKAFIKHLVFTVEEVTKCNLWSIAQRINRQNILRSGEQNLRSAFRNEETR